MAKRKRTYGKVFETDAGWFVIEYFNGRKRSLLKIARFDHIRDY